MVYFIPTPIGNLGDISFRAIEVLKEVSYIYCEDTRVTKSLLNLLSQKYNIEFSFKKFISMHSHNEKDILSKIDICFLKENSIAYLSDAGMPCVSDPGSLFVDFCIKNDISYEVLPGANALLLAYSSSGFSGSFIFWGFVPHKKRKEFLEEVLKSKHISILYEAPHRIEKLLKELDELDSNREIFIVKELTKMYQKSFKGTIKEAKEFLSTINTKGEWVVVINLNSKKDIDIKEIENLNLPIKEKAKLIAKATGKKTKEVYKELLKENG